MLTLEELTRRMRDLPPLPDLVLKLLRMCQDPEVAPRDIVEVIQLDPALTVKVLRLCNSPFYGVPRKVTSLRGAVVYLGADAIVNYVLAGCLASFYGRKKRGQPGEENEAWRDAVGTAVCAQALSERSGDAQEPLAFTCGLLHDIGKIVLGEFADTNAFVPPDAERHGIAFLETERAALGFDHAEAGAILARQWNLPEEIVLAIRWHHDPLQAGNQVPLVCLVHLGGALCESLGADDPAAGLALRCRPDVLEHRRMTVGGLLEIAATVREKIGAAIETLKTA